MDELEKTKIDLLKIEYQVAAQRYENVYKAIWQIFQYVVALAAAILVFREALPLWIAGPFAAIPLLFWYFTTFIPLNRYGDETGVRLSNIERILNSLAFTEGGTVKGTVLMREPDKPRRLFNRDVSVELSHYSEFDKRYEEDAEDKASGQLETEKENSTLDFNNIKTRSGMGGVLYNLAYGKGEKPSVRNSIRNLGLWLLSLIIAITILPTLASKALPDYFRTEDSPILSVQFEEGAGATIIANEESSDFNSIDLEKTVTNLGILTQEVDTLTRQVRTLSETTTNLEQAVTNLESISEQTGDLREAFDSLLERLPASPEQEENQ